MQRAGYTGTWIKRNGIRGGLVGGTAVFGRNKLYRQWPRPAAAAARFVRFARDPITYVYALRLY